ncbi:hypothetical protein PHYSODRAFT_342505 [Phytophthora sojae]|uniref:FAD/NAD(P)-binding domain-containing protein n=1 Tax=Phytophthora sojae (strain P6497) TaxID=1094619 RepID=G5AGT3_PHYSP|nr:hypothetical protein PHYSODRAFT_342505 [Phytophthora sojae]EGZ05363.1 hypothetical protein PHYSODRAFT_342505 [Phytophthora sojae]|eukprot:XP_009539284.1 hypothetical protein PHYSODRAFT_342505 [Phytophthora sojae]
MGKKRTSGSTPTFSSFSVVSNCEDESPWASDEQQRFLLALEQFGGGQCSSVTQAWQSITTAVGTRDIAQTCTTRALYLVIDSGAIIKGTNLAVLAENFWTVPDNAEQYYHAVGTPRAVVDAGYTKKLVAQYGSVIPPSAKAFVKIQRAVVARIVSGANEVEYAPIHEDGDLLAGKSLSYDYLVVATGSTYTVPIKQSANNFKPSTTEAKLAKMREQVKAASSALIVGGGAVGVEVAGEIKAKYPSKTVTILEGKDKLVASYDGVKVVLGERLTERLNVNSFEKRTLRTDKGTEIESDIQLLCGGFRPTSELIQKLDASLVTPEGFIKVNSKLQLDSAQYSNIYALGDASNSPAPKRMFYAGLQGKHLGPELALVARKTQTNVSKPFPKVEVVGTMLPLGPNGGVSQLPVMGSVIMVITKSSSPRTTSPAWHDPIRAQDLSMCSQERLGQQEFRAE